MSLDALQKQLIREFRASPAKAIALVVLFGVGLWYWVPMIVRPLRKSDPAPPPAETIVAAPTSAAATPTTVGANSAKPAATDQLIWQETAERMDQDRRMQSAAHPDDARDPFAHPMAEAAELELASKPVAAPSIRITPRDLGLSVSSIALGPGGRTAMINGETYREGASIDAGDGIAFDLVKVFPRRVLLARNGDEFELATEMEPVSGIRKRKP